MSMLDGIDTGLSNKVLVGQHPAFDAQAERFGPTERPMSAAHSPRLTIEPEAAADDLVRLVLALVETVRQLLEKQAIRRVESGALSDEEIERLGLALLALETRMTELKSHFSIGDDDLSLKLGSIEDIEDLLHQSSGRMD